MGPRIHEGVKTQFRLLLVVIGLLKEAQCEMCEKPTKATACRIHNHNNFDLT